MCFDRAAYLRQDMTSINCIRILFSNQSLDFHSCESMFSRWYTYRTRVYPNFDVINIISIITECRLRRKVVENLSCFTFCLDLLFPSLVVNQVPLASEKVYSSTEVPELFFSFSFWKIAKEGKKASELSRNFYNNSCNVIVARNFRKSGPTVNQAPRKS